jgi:glycosyltransferase involved in cell wall biosynthesis
MPRAARLICWNSGSAKDYSGEGLLLVKTRIKVLFQSTFNTPFIQDDIDTLENNFIVRKLTGSGVFHLIRLILLSFQADLFFSWFASVYAGVGVFMAKFVGIKSIVCLGGVDVTKEPEYNYGIWLSSWKSKFVRYALRHAECIIVLDPCLGEDARRLAEYDGKNIVYLRAGFNSSFWKPIGIKENSVLTVAVAKEKNIFIRKGLDLLIEAARMLPGLPFTVVGTDPKLAAQFNPPANMTFLPKMEHHELLPYYQRAKVYAQPSRREGLPHTLCEAMLCGCIPVGSQSDGIPTAIGNDGILIPPKNALALAEAIRWCMETEEDIGSRARARIVAMFQKEKREREIIRLVKELAS